MLPNRSGKRVHPAQRMWLLCVFVSLNAFSRGPITSGEREISDPENLLVFPENPTTHDQVSLMIVRGVMVRECYPTYRSTFEISRLIEDCTNPPCLPAYSVALQGAEHQLVCVPLRCSVGECLFSDYHGPNVTIGKLDPGSYTVTWGEEEVGTFLVVQAEEGITLSGRVREDVRPRESLVALEGTSVYLQVPWRNPDPSEQDVFRIWYTVVESTSTDNEGVFSFEDLYSGTYRLLFRHRGFQSRDKSVELKSDTTVAVSLLPEGLHGTISGRVTWTNCRYGPGAELDEGDCFEDVAEGLQVKAVCNGEAYGATTREVPLGRPWESSTFTDEHGEYVLDSIPVRNGNQPVTVTVRGYGFASEAAKVVLLPQALEASVDLKLNGDWTNRGSMTIGSDGGTLPAVRTSFVTNKPIYYSDEYVAARYSLANLSALPREITYNSSNCQYDFRIVRARPGRDDEILFSEFEGKSCNDDAVVDTVPPGDSVTVLLEGRLPNVNKTQILLLECVCAACELLGAGGVSVGVTVRGSSTASVCRLPLKPRKGALHWTIVDNRLHLTLRSPRHLRLAGFMLDGTRVLKVPRRHFDAGVYSLALDDAPSGVMLIHITGEGMNRTVKACISGPRR